MIDKVKFASVQAIAENIKGEIIAAEASGGDNHTLDMALGHLFARVRAQIAGHMQLICLTVMVIDENGDSRALFTRPEPDDDEVPISEHMLRLMRASVRHFSDQE